MRPWSIQPWELWERRAAVCAAVLRADRRREPFYGAVSTGASDGSGAPAALNCSAVAGP